MLILFRNQLNIAAPTLQQVQQQHQGVPTLPVQQKHDINLGDIFLKDIRRWSVNFP